MAFKVGDWIKHKRSKLRCVHHVIACEEDCIRTERHSVISVWPPDAEGPQLLILSNGQECELVAVDDYEKWHE